VRPASATAAARRPAHATDVPFANDKIKVKATFSGTMVTGTLSETFTPQHQHVSCKSGTISFTATTS
jgi:hypothetical protein